METNLDAANRAGSLPVSGATPHSETLVPAGVKVLPVAVIQIGFWSAILSAFLAAGWAVAMIIQNAISPPTVWTGIQAFASSFQFIQMLNLVFALPLAASFLVMMASIYFYAAEDKKIWAMLGLSFTLLYTVMATINYLVQLVTVRISLISSETEGLGLFVMGNQHSVFWALANSYAYMSLAMLFAAWVFGSSRLERWIRWLFAIVGITAPIQLAGMLFQWGLVVGIPAGLIWSISVPLACFLLAVLFRRAGQRAF